MWGLHHLSEFAERTSYATERDVERERRAAASVDHRRVGSSEPGVVGKKVVMQTGEFAMLLTLMRVTLVPGHTCSPLYWHMTHITRT